MCDESTSIVSEIITFLRKIKHREKSRCMKQKFKTHEGNFTEEISQNVDTNLPLFDG